MPESNVPVILTARVARFNLGDPDDPLDSGMVCIRVGDLGDYFQVVPWDPTNPRKGFQRESIPRHISYLRGVMTAKKHGYTPANFSAACGKYHLANLKIEEDNGVRTASFPVSRDHPLPLIDGGHRLKALMAEREEAKDDAERVQFVEDQEVWVQVYFTKDLLPHFQNLQKGKTVERNLIATMAPYAKQLDEKDKPFWEFASKVITSLNHSNKSHLHNQVRLGSKETAKFPVLFSSLISPGSSEQATTVFGGAKIALAFNQGPEWLTLTYTEAWEALLNYAEREEDEDPLPIQPNHMLWPTVRGGKKGAAHFICWIANALAFKKGYQKHAKAKKEDLQLIADIAVRHFGGPLIGWSATDKREQAKRWAQSFFADMGLPDYEGVPVPLVEIMSPGAFKIDKALLKDEENEKKGDLAGQLKLPGVEAEIAPTSNRRRRPKSA